MQKVTSFDNGNVDKTELVQELKRLLEEKGFYTESSDVFNTKFFFKSSHLKAIKVGCNSENIQKMCDLLKVDGYNDAADFYNYCRSHGLFYVEPRIYGKSKEVPSIILGIDKYIHWFRGYHFQISNTHNGIGEVYSGPYRLDAALYNLQDLPEDVVEEAKRQVFVACFVQVLLYEHNGYKAYKNIEMLDEFLKMSGKLSRVDGPRMKDFEDLRKVSKYAVKPEMIQNPCDEGQPKAIRLAYDDTSYALLELTDTEVRLTVSKPCGFIVNTLHLPKWLFMRNEYDERYIEDPGKLICIFVNALLTDCEFRANYMAMYPIGLKKNNFMPINYNVPMITDKWDDVEDAIIEYYN